jgi:8-oxo-dGTP diphosphatase
MQLPSEQDYIQQISIDCVIFGYQNDQLHVLIPKLKFEGNFFALPSGFVLQDEDLDAAATRILQERTQISGVQLHQFYCFGKANRNSRAFMDLLIRLNPELDDLEQANRKEYDWFTRRFISVGYYALVDINKVIARKSDLDQSVSWRMIGQLPDMIMDHNHIFQRAIHSLRSSFDERLSAFELLPETFTMKELQKMYESIFERQFPMNNFQKKILDMDVLERLEKKFTGAANKAPYVYRLKDNLRK